MAAYPHGRNKYFRHSITQHSYQTKRVLAVVKYFDNLTMWGDVGLEI